MQRAEKPLGRGAHRWVAGLLATCALALPHLVTGGAGASAAPPEPGPVETTPATTGRSDDVTGPPAPLPPEIQFEPVFPPEVDDRVEESAATPGDDAQSHGPLALPALVIGSGAAGGGSAAAGAGRPAQRLQQLGSIPFPIQPLPKCQVLDSFADARSGGRSHEGIDILASLGQPVFAVADGTLTKQYLDGVQSALSGNGWKLSLADRTFFFYAHLSGFAEGLVVGSKVKRGDVIGYVGDTGNPGPGNYHLHFEYHPLGGAAVDTFPMIEIPATCKVH